jgi:hypothetical protein
MKHEQHSGLSGTMRLCTQVDITSLPTIWPHCEAHYMAVFERFVRGIGDDSRFKVEDLKLSTQRHYRELVPNVEYTEGAYIMFTRVTNIMLDCVSLTSISLTITDYYLLQDEQMAVEAFLFHD